jgi:hypothetical protein
MRHHAEDQMCHSKLEEVQKEDQQHNPESKACQYIENDNFSKKKH